MFLLTLPQPFTPAQPQTSPATMGAASHSATPVTTQMTVVTTVMNRAAPSPHVTLLPSSPALTDAASAPALSVMATTTVGTMLPPTKSTAVSNDETNCWA